MSITRERVNKKKVHIPIQQEDRGLGYMSAVKYVFFSLKEKGEKMKVEEHGKLIHPHIRHLPLSHSL